MSRTARQLPHAARSRGGFTLIELMAVVVVIGLLAAVALPSFLDSVRKGRRAEAHAALAQLQQAQERWRANNSTYTGTLADLKLNLDASAHTPGDYYVVNIDSADGTGYTATANAVSGSSQAGDTQCTTMRVRLTGGNLQYGGCSGCSVPGGALADPNRCWSR